MAKIKQPAPADVAEKEPAEAPAGRKRLFGVAKKVMEVSSGPDLNNLELVVGDNKFRILGAPIYVLKHWDLPETAEISVLPCRKHIEDIEAYVSDPEGYLATLDECEGCQWEAAHGGKEGFYNARLSLVFNVAHNEGEKIKDEESPWNGLPKYVVKVAEFHQKSIVNGIADLEENPDWQELMPNGITDLELNVKREEKKGKGGKAKTEYTVGAVPTSKPLPDDYLAHLMSKCVDLVTLKAPPDETRWAELMKKCDEPQEGEKPKRNF